MFDWLRKKKISDTPLIKTIYLPNYVTKAKVISGFDFENNLNDFIKDKNVVDIKYGCCTVKSSYIYDRALVIYREVEHEG